MNQQITEARKQWINETNEPTNHWINGSTNHRTIESTNQRVIEPMKHWSNGAMNECIKEYITRTIESLSHRFSELMKHSSLNKRTNESLNDTAAWLGLMQWVNEPMQKWTNKSVSPWTKKSMNQWMDGWMNKWMGVWTDGWVSYFFPWAISSLNGYLFSQLLLLWAASGLLCFPVLRIFCNLIHPPAQPAQCVLQPPAAIPHSASVALCWQTTFRVAFTMRLASCNLP